MRPAALLLLLAGCASSPQTNGSSSPSGLWPMAGARCSGGDCVCRDANDQSEAQPPVAPAKRYELRTGRGLDPTEVLVDGKVALARKIDHPEEQCAYIDLPPGHHEVELRVRAKQPEAGIQPTLSVAEWGPKAGSWYHTLDMVCTSAEGCTKDDIRDVLEKLHTVARGLFDPCGSTRVSKLGWHAERSPNARLDDLIFDFELHIYEFLPKKKSGDATCGEGHGG